MWHTSIIRYILTKQVNKIVVIEAIETKDGNTVEFVFNCVMVLKANGIVTMGDAICGANGDQLEEWLQNVNKNALPLLLVLNGERILHKMLENQQQLSEEEKIKFIIPGAESDKFLAFSFFLSEKVEFISVARKSMVESVLQSLNASLENIIQLVVGPSPVFLSHSLFAVQMDASSASDIVFRNYSFHFDDDMLTEFDIRSYSLDDDKGRTVKFAGDDVPEAILIPYSLAIAFFVDPFALKSVGGRQIKRNNEEFVFRTVARKLGTLSAVVLISVLLVSSVVFTIYNSKSKLLNAKYMQARQKAESMNAKTAAYVKQRKIFAENGLIDKSRISYYADQLTATLPDAVYLSKLDIHPLNSRTISDNVDFLTNKILVEGNCYSSTELNQWVNVLKRLPWVTDVLIRDYKDNDDIGAFSLEITKQSR